VTVHVDQSYREISGISLRYDFFRPEQSEIVPLVIVIHGGGWISGCKEDMRELALPLVRHGFAVAIPNYRLAPLHPFPAAVEDMEEFVHYVRTHSKEFGIDPNQVGSVGISAGGHLSAMLGVSQRWESRPNAVVDVCGLADLTNPYERHAPVSWGFIDQFLPFSWEDSPEKFEEASPICHVTTDLPPFLVIHGDSDDVVDVSQSDEFVEKLRECHNEVRYLRLEGEDHNFSGGSWPVIEGEIVEFFHRELR
jgi:acetyl esterase/lipase